MYGPFAFWYTSCHTSLITFYYLFIASCNCNCCPKMGLWICITFPSPLISLVYKTTGHDDNDDTLCKE